MIKIWMNGFFNGSMQKKIYNPVNTMLFYKTVCHKKWQESLSRQRLNSSMMSIKMKFIIESFEIMKRREIYGWYPMQKEGRKNS